MGFHERRCAGNFLPELLILALVLTLTYAALDMTDMGGSLPSLDAIQKVGAWAAEDFVELTADRFDQLWDASKGTLRELADLVTGNERS